MPASRSMIIEPSSAAATPKTPYSPRVRKAATANPRTRLSTLKPTRNAALTIVPLVARARRPSAGLCAPSSLTPTPAVTLEDGGARCDASVGQRDGADEVGD